MSRRLIHTLLIALTLLLGAGCSYFNAFYNTQRSFKEAEAERERSTNLDAQPAQYNDAVESGARLIEMYPESKYIDDALFIMGQSYYWLKDYHNARRKFEELLSNYPDSPHVMPSRMWLGKVNVQLRKRQEATSLLRGLIADTNDPQLIAESRFALAELYFVDSSFVQAGEEFARIPELAEKANDDDLAGRAYWRAGQSMYFEHRYDEAAEYLEQALDLGLTTAMRFRARLVHAQALMYSGHVEDALRIFNSMLKDKRYFEDHGVVRVQKGIALERLGRREEAFDEWQRTIDDHPRSDEAAQAYYQMGLTYLDEMGRRPDAKEMFDKARTEKARSRYSLKSDTLLTQLNRVDQLSRDRRVLNHRIDFTERWIANPIKPADTLAFRTADYYDSLAVDTLRLASLWSTAWRDSVIQLEPDSTLLDSAMQDSTVARAARALQGTALDSSVALDALTDTTRIRRDTLESTSPTLDPMAEYSGGVTHQTSDPDDDEDILLDESEIADTSGSSPFEVSRSPADVLNTPQQGDSAAIKADDPGVPTDPDIPVEERDQIPAPDKLDAPRPMTDDPEQELAMPGPPGPQDRDPDKRTPPDPRFGPQKTGQDSVVLEDHDPDAFDQLNAPDKMHDPRSASELPPGRPGDRPASLAEQHAGSGQRQSREKGWREALARKMGRSGPDSAQTEGSRVDLNPAESPEEGGLLKNDPDVETITIFDTAPVLDSLGQMRADLQDARFQLGEIQLFDLQQPDSARLIFKELADPPNVDSVRARALTVLAYIEREHGRDSTAADSILRRVAQEFPSTRSGRQVIDALGIVKEEPVTPAEEAYREAESLLVSEQKEHEAYTRYRWIASTYPNSPWAPRSMYAAAYIAGRYLDDGETAEELFTSLIDEYPESPQAQRARKKISAFDAIRFAGGEQDTVDLATQFADIDAFSEEEVDQTAQIIGGMETLSSTLETRNLLPQEVIQGTGGEVLLRFVIGTDQQAGNFKIVMEDPPGSGLGRALVAGLEQVQFSPARKDGEPVATKVERRYTLPLDAPPNIRPLPKR